MRQGLSDLVALLRCGRLAIGLPEAVAAGSRMLHAVAESYEDVVAPIVARTISDMAERSQVDQALAAAAVKVGLYMLAYARLARCEPPPGVVALAGSATRLYDDLIDGSLDLSLDERLGELFGGRPFTAHDHLEHLLAALVSEIRQRVQPAPGGTVNAAINALHEYECLSRRQREEAVPMAVLEKICRGKGAMANLTLCSLVKPQLGTVERELIMSLGETYQSVDDYADVEQDQLNGVVTPATLGEATLSDIVSGMRRHRREMLKVYGTAQVRPYFGMVYFLLLKAVVGRRLPFIGRFTVRLVRGSPVLALLIRGAEALPASLENRGTNEI